VTPEIRARAAVRRRDFVAGFLAGALLLRVGKHATEPAVTEAPERTGVEGDLEQSQLHPAQADLTTSGLKGRAFFVYNGNPIYLVGIDAQELVADPAYDYPSVLDRLQVYRINKLRIWTDAWFVGVRGFRPWTYDVRTGRFNLDVWNDEYWTRLRSFAAAALARDIIVEVSIFDAYPADSGPKGWWFNPFYRQAWNKDFNSNGAFSTNSSGNFYPEFYSLDGIERSSSGKTLRDYQQALVDKVIATFNPFPNVYFEIDNEFGLGGNQDAVHPWQEYWAKYVSQRSGKVVDVHAGGDDRFAHYYWDLPYVGGIDFHLYEQNPDKISLLLHSSQRKGKFLQCNESYAWYLGNSVNAKLLDNATRAAWGWFVSGGYYGFYNGHRTQYSGWDLMARRAKILHDLADTVQWWRMSPVDSSGGEYDALVSWGPTPHWQVLASPPSQYVVYYWDDGRERPTAKGALIQLPQGVYQYSWYDPTSGDGMASGVVTSRGGRTRIVAPPPTWDRNVGAVLVVKRTQ